MKKLFLSFSFILTCMSLILIPQGLQASYNVTVHEQSEVGFSVEDPDTYINDVDSPVSVEDLMVLISVSDDHDGDISGEIYILLDYYTENIDVLGDHLVIFGVTDSGGNETSFAITVKNVDITNPTFTVEVESTLNIPQNSILSANLPNISASDSYEGDLTPGISINGLELIDTAVLGTYTLIYSVSDTSGNQTVETFIVNVVDAEAPIINGVDEIIKRADVILESDFFLEYITASDNIDGIVSNRIEIVDNEYIGHANTPGTYEVRIKATDIQGNYAYHTFTIKVVSSMVPRLIVDNYYWVIDNTDDIQDSGFVDVLKNIGDLPNFTYVFTAVYDNYSSQNESLGVFQKSFSLTSSAGNEYERDLIIQVVEAEMNILPEVITPGVEIPWKIIIGVSIFVIILGTASYGAYKGMKKG